MLGFTSAWALLAIRDWMNQGKLVAYIAKDGDVVFRFTVDEPEASRIYRILRSYFGKPVFLTEYKAEDDEHIYSYVEFATAEYLGLKSGLCAGCIRKN